MDASAIYTGGTSHLGANDVSPIGATTPASTPFEKLDSTVATEVHNPAHTDITNSSVTEGTLVHDQATVSGTVAGGTPTGTVDFTLYPGLECIGTPISAENNVVLNGSGVAESTPTAPADGTYSYLAHYDGDANYNEATAACEPFTITQLDPLVIEKTANTSFTRTWNWTINKSVTPGAWDLFTGDSGTSDYTITLDKVDSTDSAWMVTGTISITNPAGNPSTTIVSVTDMLDSSGPAVVVCPGGLPQALAGGATLVCTYSASPGGTSDSLNTATVTTNGAVSGGSDDAAVVWGAPTTVVNDSVSVDDTYPAGDFGPVSSDTVHNYSRTFACDADEGTHNNTATIVETGQNDSASVEVNCHALEVTKNADESFDRKYNWSINKVGDQTDLTLAPGEVFTVNYDVTVDMTGSVDSNWMVGGTITVHNPAPVSATINSVADIITGPIPASIDCSPAVFPYTLGAGADLVCTYSSALPDGTTRRNTATAVQQNYDYDSAGTPTPDGTTDYSGNASVDFAGATMSQIDECIDVTDTFGGSLGTVCVGDALPKTFEYTHDVGPYTDQDCGTTKEVDNTATFVTTDDQNDTDATGSDDHNVTVQVTCTCTLTQGYWKTHSQEGPAPYDDNWQNLPGGLQEDTLFFNSGMTWYQLFWTSPKGGNAYIQLAHQYMAAKLNILSGASSTPAVDAAIAGAEALFNAQGAGDMTLTKPETTQARNYAGTLGSYNEGLIGPGHCDEQNGI